MSSGRPQIPAGVKRELRQEAGFGCCICGLPIIQYHHIVEWSKEEHHRQEDMMILCPLHHDAATKGVLSEEEQRAAKEKPKNIRDGLALGQLASNQGHLAIQAGGILLVSEGPVIELDGEPLLITRLDASGALLISLFLYDQHDRLIACIDENEWISGDPFPWDIEADHQFFKLRSNPYDVRLSLDLRGEPASFTGKLWRGGSRVSVRSRGIYADNGQSSIQELALVGLALNVKSDGGIEIKPVGEEGFMISEADRVSRLHKALNAFHGIGRPHGLLVEPSGSTQQKQWTRS